MIFKPSLLLSLKMPCGFAAQTLETFTTVMGTDFAASGFTTRQVRFSKIFKSSRSYIRLLAADIAW